MNQRAFIFLIILGLFIPVIATATTPTQEDIHMNADADFWVDTLDWYSWYWTDLDVGAEIVVDVEVTSGNDIDFFIIDGENYDLWVDGESSSAYRIQNNVGSVSESFIVPRSGEWRVVFRNDNWLYRKHIEGTINAYAPTTTTTSDMSLAAAAIAIGLILFLLGMACVCAKKYEERKQEPTQAYQSPHQPPYQSAPIQKEPVLIFCPSCGTRRQSLDAQFCSKCGRAFSGPEFG